MEEKELKQTETVEKEAVEVEILDEKKEETVAEETTEVVEEVVEPGITRGLNITEASYTEFFNRNLIKRQLITTAYTVLIMVVVMYLFRGDMEMPEFLKQLGIFTAAIVVISVLFGLISSKFMVKKNYFKSGIGTITINVTINGKGVLQQVADQQALTYWEELASVEETDISLFFLASNRKAIILSKDNLQPGDIEFIRSIAQSKLGEDKYVIKPSKQPKNN